ncbi:MAG: hypothetical protein AAGA03_19080, partial [Planctomycetota bacterium]
ATEVPAQHFAVVSIDSQNSVVAKKLTQPIHRWSADLQREAEMGKWLPASHAFRMRLTKAMKNGRLTSQQARERYLQFVADSDPDDGSLIAQPRQIGTEQTSKILFIASVHVAQNQSRPVVIKPNSWFRVRGSVGRPASVGFGLAARRFPQGPSKRYQAKLELEDNFDVTLDASDFAARDNLLSESSDAGSEQLLHFWTSTESVDADLQITSVELGRGARPTNNEQSIMRSRPPNQED